MLQRNDGGRIERKRCELYIYFFDSSMITLEFLPRRLANRINEDFLQSYDGHFLEGGNVYNEREGLDLRSS